MIQTIDTPHDSYVWIDLIDPTSDELKQIAEQFQLHPNTVLDSTQPEHLPKFEVLDDNRFFAICRLYDDECDQNADSMNTLTRKLAIFFGNKYIITMHRKKFESYELVKEKYRESRDINEVVCKIFKSTFVTFEQPIEKLDKQIDFYETRIFLRKRIPDLLKSLYLIKRRVYVFRKLFNLSKDTVDKMRLYQTQSPVFQDMHDHYVKFDTLVEELHESIMGLMNIYISLASQRTNEVMRVLTVFSAFFLPLTFIVGIYGMNFPNMPEINHPYGYAGTWIVMLIITVLIFRWFKRKSWM